MRTASVKNDAPLNDQRSISRERCGSLPLTNILLRAFPPPHDSNNLTAFLLPGITTDKSDRLKAVVSTP
ncbi:MAG: hypothetical protein L3J88_01485 [Gammaproteobacteria bacterium]|nr:hypothetical protein [Gammaproteobacteria bacterium]